MPDGSHQPPEIVTKVVASAVSIVVGLSNDRQITFQTGFEGDEPDAAVNERFDRIMRLADRQKARYQIPEIEEELFQHRETLANFVEDRDRLETNHVHDQAARQVQIDEMERLRSDERAKVRDEIDGTILKIQAKRQSEWEEGQAEHRRTGRMSPYKPAGLRKSNIEHCDQALATAKDHRELAMQAFEQDYDAKIEAVRAEIVKADAERQQALSNKALSIERYEAAIAEREAKLARCKALAEG